jgi:ferredoxin
LDADVVISLPKLKTHVQAKYTGAVKNFFGVIPQSQRKYLHRIGTFKSLSSGIVDIYSVVKHDFGLMDAIISMEGNGPSKGSLRNTGFLIASSDCVALDSIACKIIGFNDTEVLHLLKAGNRGLGYSDIREIEVVGDVLLESLKKFKKPRIQGGNVPTFLMDMTFYFYKREPFVDNKLCVLCGYCKSVCPVSAVKLDDHAKIIREKCIECFCCYEVCPQSAIELKRSFLYRILKKVKSRKG